MMATYTYPGVYMEEVSSGVRPIQAAGTSTAAFFGVAQRGPIGEVKKIFNFTEFGNIYGDFLGDSFLAHAVYQFFNNGGSQCYVGRVANNPRTASITIRDRFIPKENDERKSKNSLTISAESAGEWGNQLMVIIDSTAADDPDNLDSTAADDPDNQFNLSLYQDNPKSDEPPVLLEIFENLDMNSQSPTYVESYINPRSKYIRIKVNLANDNYQKGYSESDEITLGETLLSDNQREFRINIHGDGYQTVKLKFQDGDDMTDLDIIRERIQEAIQRLKKLRKQTHDDAYKVTVTIVGTDKNKLRIESGQKSVDSSVEIINAADIQKDAAGALHLGRKNKGKEIFGSEPMRPQNTPDKPKSPDDNYYFLGDDTEDTIVSKVVPGDDGSQAVDQDFIKAFHWLDTIRDVSLIAVPGIGSAAVIDEGMNYCLNGRPLSDCFFIGDMTPDDIVLDDATEFRLGINTPNSYGALYFPWLKMLDPRGLSTEPLLAPPSGYIAGLYSRVDSKRGVWKAPAGTEAMLGGAVGLAAELTDIEHGNLNKKNKSVCVIRKFPGSGIVAWGARTLSSDPEYKYIPVRRTAIMLRVSIFNGIQWAVFEPNDEELWARLRLNIGSFMRTLFRRGAFQGSSPAEAYFVKCDSETTPQEDIDLGIVNVLVGFAPLKPAEFVVVKISQKAGQAS
jgi:phage tail sheath protein FI